jgi:hypothetical protein
MESTALVDNAPVLVAALESSDDFVPHAVLDALDKVPEETLAQYAKNMVNLAIDTTHRLV